MLWQDVPVNGIAGWMGRPFRRVTTALVASAVGGAPYVEVEYLSAVPDGEVDVGDRGLIEATDPVEHIGSHVSCCCPECVERRAWRGFELGLSRLCTPFYSVLHWGDQVRACATFDEALAFLGGRRELCRVQGFRFANYQIVNTDRADDSGDGLTDDEIELMEECL